ncbi:DUF3492 domain-containing protein [Streptomyces spirodelae]|uniref:D-inositol 3-phosphate glycosyltransferase n=1 Tax=Streptomyces spirodelae TaxID=2812904 RepID=A0ABS3WVW1_9ACTN|nr:DUF3492 domain-containing protein [Streptomyces spirodelae]MBO8186981.1 DUF3492 domain-containing protein [Streptomyces spirodelae]
MRIALLTEGGYPYVRGESALWCDRLLRGLDGHEFAVFALSRSARQEETGWCELPPGVTLVRTAPLWGPGPGTQGARGLAGGAYGRREKRRFREHFAALAEAVCANHADADPRTGPLERTGSPGTPGPDAGDRSDRPRRSDRTDRPAGGLSAPAVGGAQGAHGPLGAHGEGRAPADGQADRFAAGLYGLAELAAERGGLATALRSESAVRILESACRAPGALPAAHAAQVPDLLAVTERLERALRPLSLDWYGQRGEEPGLSAADLCHAVGAGPAALPGLLAKRAFGVPLLITEYGVRLREHYLTSAVGAVARGVAGAPVRALLASFQRRLAREAYEQAELITPGNSHARRWQVRCGADSARLRTVYPGMDAAPFDAVGEQVTDLPPADGARPAGAPTLVWVGTSSPAKDLGTLLHAFARVREAVPTARLRIVETAGPGGPDGTYLAHCRALAERLFPPGARKAERPVTFEEVGTPAVPTPADAYALGGVVVLSSVVEGFPVSLVEAMFCGRATVSTDVGAALEVVGGTGLLVPPRDPRALAEACADLLRDPARAARLGAAARARALELFTVRQNVESFRGIYLELISRHRVGREDTVCEDPAGEDAGRPFARPAEAHLPGRWASGTGNGSTGSTTSSAASSVVCGVTAHAVSGAEGLRTGSRSGGRPGGTKVAGGSLAHVPSWASAERAAPEETAARRLPAERPVGQRAATDERPVAEWAAVGAEPGEATAP